jgi:hypothetical protein
MLIFPVLFMLKILISFKHQTFPPVTKGLNFIQDITLPKKKINVMAHYYTYIKHLGITTGTNLSNVIKGARKVQEDC